MCNYLFSQLINYKFMLHFLLYIDPGSGSIFFQAILSLLATSLLFFNKVKLLGFTIWTSIKKVIRGQ